MWLVVEPAGLVWLWSSWEGSWRCETVSSYQLFTAQCLAQAEPGRLQFAVSLAVLWLSLSCMRFRRGRSFNFSHCWRTGGGAAADGGVRWCNSHLCLFAVGLYATHPGKDAYLLSLGVCEMAREGSKWDDESGLRGPAAHRPGSLFVLQLTPQSMNESNAKYWTFATHSADLIENYLFWWW